ncbi:MAG: hypothetical protein KF760_26655 [Candidatus Eremiobacteraeota bacterium]|nr:hypothetical protein [Candidatus Eremiobacteraeota bacterium]MCW5868815.1 hypothetical protein [Candidatus Eremiobacteraeota bacterium]
MHIQSNSPQIPQRLEVRVQNQDPQLPQEPKDQVSKPEAEPESFGHKAFRVLSRTAIGAGVGYVGGLVSQQPGTMGTLGTVYMGVHGLGEGAATGWHVGKRVGLAFASGNGNEVARGGLALGATFGGPFLGAIGGTAAGIAAAAGGPLVGAAVFGGMTLAKELAR